LRKEKLEKRLTVAELIQETRKCRKTVEVCLLAGHAGYTILSYRPKEFNQHLHKFAKHLRHLQTFPNLKVPNWKDEELLLVLHVDKAHVEFQSKARLTRPNSGGS
jgi:hypothetical protein